MRCNVYANSYTELQLFTIQYVYCIILYNVHISVKLYKIPYTTNHQKTERSNIIDFNIILWHYNRAVTIKLKKKNCRWYTIHCYKGGNTTVNEDSVYICTLSIVYVT